MLAEPEDVMARRTRELARPVGAATHANGILLLHFSLGGEQMAIEARWLLGVEKVSLLASLPGAAPPIRGVTVWRGDLLTVLDIRPTLGISTAALSDLTRILVLGGRRARFGLLVDTVSEVAELPTAALLPVPPGSLARDYLIGVTADAGLVLDGQRLMQLFD